MNLLRGWYALTHRELKKWIQQPILLFMGIVQPTIWMGLFGKAFGGAVSAGGSQAAVAAAFGTSDYFSFVAVGMPAFVVLFTAVFSGMSIVWDRRMGFLGKVLSTPVPRGAVVGAKMGSAVVRSLVQATIIFGLALAFGLRLSAELHWFSLPLVVLGLLLMSLGLAGLFTAIAVRSTRWETQMAVVNLLNLPLLFASNALYPVSIMPSWLQPFVPWNPVSHATDLARQLLLFETDWALVAGDLVFLAGFAALFAGVGWWMSTRYLSK